MNKFLTKGAMAIVFGGLLVSCHEDIATGSVVAEKLKAYDELFKQEFPNMDANHDWGFGTTTTDEARSLTRAAFTTKWTDDHSCDWASKLNFAQSKDALPAGAIDITNLGSYSDANGDNSGAVYYIPSTFSGELDVNYKVKLKAGMSLYNFGKVTGIKQINLEGIFNIYNTIKSSL